MGKNRYIDTHFWKDNYIIELDPSEKLLFLYLLSNPHANIAWIYEISIREISFDTWFDRDLIIRLLDRFSKDNKIHYIEWYIYLVNSIKHQKLNPSIKKWIEIIVNNIKSNFWQELAKNEKLYTGCLQALTYININTNLNINTNTNINGNENSCEFSESDSEESDTPKSDLIINKKENSNLKQLADEFFTTDFLKELLEKYKISAEELKSEITIFAWYWTEKSKNWKKERWQMEKSFDIRLRLYRWLNNNNKWSKDSSWNFEKNNWIILVPDNF